MRVLSFSLLLATLAGLVAAQPAVGLFAPSFCHERTYTARHLAANPEQQVRVIRVGLQPRGGASDHDVVDLAVQVRGSEMVYRSSAVCPRPAGGRLDCWMDGDAGTFALSAATGGALRLALTGWGITFESSMDDEPAAAFLQLSATTGDDRVFLIPPAAAAACN